MNRYALKGSYTVEAAAIVSITFLVLASMLLGMFYLHDRAVFQGAACEAAAAGSNFATEAERKKAAGEVAKRLKKGRFLGSRGITGGAETGSGKTTASWQAGYPVPGFAMKYLSGGRLGIDVSWSCGMTDAADMIRKIRGVGALLAGGEH